MAVAAEEEIAEVAAALGTGVAEVRAKVDAMHEYNPMLGHRGCRLGITFPEIYRMQARAIARLRARSRGAAVRMLPEIMIPLVAHTLELARLRELVSEEVRRVFRERGCACRAGSAR